MSGEKHESGPLNAEDMDRGRGVASPPCLMHEADPAYFGYLSTGEVVALLGELLEGERAGARVASRLGHVTIEPELWATLMNMRDDEARFCAMLSRHIARLGAIPSREASAFEGKVLAIADMRGRLRMLNRGQEWVVRKLREALPRIFDDELQADLQQMLRVHEQNIERCASFAP